MKFSELDGRQIALWGLGRETSAFRTQLQRRLPAAAISAVIDDATPEEEARKALAGADVLVRSPGVSIYKPLIQEAIRAGTTVSTATGLWLAERGGHHVIGVTGTKGKSTTATVIAHLIRATGTPVELAGNIGRPVIELLDLDADVWVVCELSSYQIADLTVGPEVAVLTNLSREHTDWHGGEERYRADKLRIFELPCTRVVEMLSSIHSVPRESVCTVCSRCGSAVRPSSACGSGGSGRPAASIAAIAAVTLRALCAPRRGSCSGSNSSGQPSAGGFTATRVQGSSKIRSLSAR